MNPGTGRNQPCPCGSGKKYKKCHGAAEDALWKSPWVWGLLMAGLGLAALGVMVKGSPPAAGPPEAGQGAGPSRQGRPWEYDAATNMHFDPSPGHNHWHQGPPPAGR